MNIRTTIMLEKPILEKIREHAHRHHETLRETIRALILAGLAKQKKTTAKPVRLSTLSLGKELVDISNRADLYEVWDKEK